jgi:predicted AAA+ superfamily ATPase
VIERPHFVAAIEKALNRSPVVALLGPRQCGKTTLARQIAQVHRATWYDLESTADLGRLENPQVALSALSGLVVLDEIQQRPDLLATLRVLADRPDQPARFLILGSASPTLVQGSAESLAGRVEFVDLGGFDMDEVGLEHLDDLWIRGSFPRSYLAASEEDSVAWRENFIRTLLERDLPQLGIRLPPVTLRRFWTMMAHYHGQIWNGSEIARSFGVNDKTVRGYLDVLTGAFMIRQLPPWFANVKKRQVKSPKIFLRDSGLLHTLLGITDRNELLGHPKSGASWEGFALEQVLRRTGSWESYFWATHGGAELDLLVLQGGRKIGIEFKLADAPKVTRSMQLASDDLELDHLWVIYPGEHRYPLTERISAVPLSQIPADLRP